MWGYGYILGIGVSLAYWMIFIVPMDRSFRKRKLVLARKRIRRSIAKNLIKTSHHLCKPKAFELAKDFPITGKVEGWYFRINEISRKNFLGEGCHTLGYRLKEKGSNSPHVLIELIAQAKEVNRQLVAHNKLNQSGTPQSGAPV